MSATPPTRPPQPGSPTPSAAPPPAPAQVPTQTPAQAPGQAPAQAAAAPLPANAPAAGLWRLLLLIGLFMMLVQVHRSGGAVIANELTAQGLRPGDVAAVIGVMFLAAAIAQLPTGLAFDRFGARLTLFGMGTVAVFGIVLFALADSALGLGTGRFLIGVGHGSVIAGIYLLTLTWVPPSRVATTTGGIIAVAGGIGGLLATAPLLAALRGFGHEATFLMLGGLTLLVTVIIGLCLRDAPAGAAVSQAARPETFTESVGGLWAVATERRLWPIYAMGAAFAAPFNALGGLWSGPYLTDVHGLSAEQASYGVFAMVGAYHLGNLLYGHVERALRSRKRTIIGGVLLQVAMLLALLIFARSDALLCTALLVLFCLFTPIYPVLAAHCRGFVPLHRAGRAIACISLVGLVTVFATQTLTGQLIELTAAPDGTPSVLGYRLVFACVLLVLLAALAGYRRVEDMPP